uniref:Transposase n=1 Tax=Elaeophora elaphi TaxID=1147741 RepID=A0A0R3RT37_9BILA
MDRKSLRWEILAKERNIVMYYRRLMDQQLVWRELQVNQHRIKRKVTNFEESYHLLNGQYIWKFHAKKVHKFRL